MDAVRVGLLGLGTVGSGVARLIRERSDLLAERSGRRIEIAWALVRDPEKVRDLGASTPRLRTDWRSALADPDVEVVVELIGGVGIAYEMVLSALQAGKSVVTANKAMLAERGPEVFEAARRAGRAIAFEGAVGGGIPIVQAIRVGLAANRVEAIAAIVNGTCNFILSAMSGEGLSYEEALARAQALGYAESDPTLDVDGTDAAHKLAVLAELAFGAGVTTSEVPRQGIDQLSPLDIKFAAELGYAIKLLARARWRPGGLELGVAPCLVRRGRRWPTSRGLITRSGSWATPWATRYSTAGARGPCRPPRRWWPT